MINLVITEYITWMGSDLLVDNKKSREGAGVNDLTLPLHSFVFVPQEKLNTQNKFTQPNN